MKFLFKVEDVFQIEGRGCVLIPGIPHSFSKERSVKRGEAIEMRRPDGSTFRSTTWQIEMISTRQQRDHTVIMIPDVPKADIPIGTEVWLVNDQGENKR